jgi:hypothetical protein
MLQVTRAVHGIMLFPATVHVLEGPDFKEKFNIALIHGLSITFFLDKESPASAGRTLGYE